MYELVDVMRCGQPRSDLGDRINAQQRAAQYVRMSTEHQKYSIANQAAAIAEYAVARAISIVKTYEDAAKSGLRLEGREGLKRLIADVKSGQTDFDTILVYDVSRWGRFQDVDESAHYEFICKQSGIKIHYCAEQFDNDGSLTTSVLKSIKRAMAAEYSRELSVKVFNGQSRVCSLGFKAGGSSGYGLRRHFVDQHGKHKGELGRGECKSLQTDRVVLAPGPKNEIETVQRIYRLFVIDRLPQTEIARVLNRDGILTEEGHAWTFGKIHGILTNEKYIGNLLYNRKSQKLHGPPVSNPPEVWIRHDGAFEPTVDIALFEAARGIIEIQTCRMTNAEMVDRLKELLHRQGSLSGPLIDAAGNMPSSATYRHRFGSLLRACELAGYKPKHTYHFIPALSRFRLIVSKLIENTIRTIELLGGTARFDRDTNLLWIDDEFTASIQPLYCNNYRQQTPRWRVRLTACPKADLVVAVRMNESNTDVLDYFLLPRIDMVGTFLWLRRRNRFEIDAYRHNSLAPLFGLCARRRIADDEGRVALL